MRREECCQANAAALLEISEPRPKGIVTMAISSWRKPAGRTDRWRTAGPLMRRLMLILLLPLTIAAAPAASPGDPDAQATAFMNHLWDHALEVLNKKTPVAERQARFRELFQRDFDCPGIARFVLGRYWRSASPEEQKEFLKLFQDYVVFVYTARLSDFGGEQFKVNGSRPDAEFGDRLDRRDLARRAATAQSRLAAGQ